MPTRNLTTTTAAAGQNSGTPRLSFDGKGLNDAHDEYRTRVCTFTSDEYASEFGARLALAMDAPARIRAIAAGVDGTGTAEQLLAIAAELDGHPAAPAFRVGAEVRVKGCPGHQSSIWHGARGVIVERHGARWVVKIHDHDGNTLHFNEAELTVLS